MIIGAMTLTIHVPWVHSLKEKRTIVKSLCAKTQNKFNISIAEIGEQDTHQTILIGLATVANEVGQINSVLDHIINFIESNTEGEIITIDREII